MSSDVIIVLCTMPATGDTAAEIARTVVGEGLVACVNLVPGVRSIYRWQGEVCDDTEVLAIMKTTPTQFEPLRSRLIELHPYDLPEVIALDITHAHPPYRDWILSEAGG